MRKTIFLTMLLLLSTVVMAGFGDGTCTMGGSYGGWSVGGKIVMVIAGIAYFVLASFVFSVVFWLTHKWLDCKCVKKKK